MGLASFDLLIVTYLSVACSSYRYHGSVALSSALVLRATGL